MKKTITELFTALIKKAERTEEMYLKALEKKQEELIEVSAELAEKQLGLKDLHKMALLGEVSEETYKEEAEKAEKLQEKIATIQNEMKLIEIYKIEDIEKVLAEIKADKPLINKAQQEEVKKIKQDIELARTEYLQRLAALGKQFDKTMKNEGFLQNALVKLGKQSSTYLPNKVEVLGSVATVDIQQVTNTL